ncbi:MAG TPA: hypothetical protein DIV79_07725 [Opitutae bacterium]|nr:hypothetical protein [Opitutaceae bacterium]HCR29887.1 hypothetical protein [Opitutae bacterium]
MSEERIDWDQLVRIRKRFLEIEENPGVYWESEEDLALYHRFFGQRIGWKWKDAIKQAKQAGWLLHSQRIVDWGCGTGIASQTLIEEIGTSNIESVTLWDHSRLAASFAKDKLVAHFPNLSVNIAEESEFEELSKSIVLVSHALNELSIEVRSELRKQLSRAQQLFFVEPGNRRCSHLLIEQREGLIDQFNPIAPCVCNQACPMTQEDNAHHWCHFFAKPPIEAFTRSDWSRFGRIMEIDLRSLPYSFLALDSISLANEPDDRSLSRVIGRPRQRKGFVELLSCDRNGLNQYQLQKRDNPSLCKSIKKNKSGSLFTWSSIDGDRVLEGSPAKPADDQLNSG